MNNARTIALAAVAAVVTVASACTDDSARDEGGVLPSAYAAPVRFVDVLDDSHVSMTPELPEPTAVLRADFDTGELLGWDIVRPDGDERRERDGIEVTTERPHSGRRCVAIGNDENPRDLPRLETSVSVAPNTAYHLTAWVRTADLHPRGRWSAGAGVELFEEQAGAILAHEHLARRRGSSPEWTRVSYVFRTAPATESVRISLVPARGDATGWAFFDEVVLYRLPDAAWAHSLPPYEDKSRALAPHRLVKRIELGGDSRPAVLAPAPTSWSARVSLPDRPTQLRFAAGRLPSPDETAACFRVSWLGRDAGDETVLFDDCLASANRWQDQRIDLSAYSGTTGTVRFETRADGAAASPLAAWGNPRITETGASGADEVSNVALIVVDTLRADRLGVEGSDRPNVSLNIDALARQSIRFSRAYSAAPWTAPSLGSVMTSQYPSEHRAGMWIDRETLIRNKEVVLDASDAEAGADAAEPAPAAEKPPLVRPWPHEATGDAGAPPDRRVKRVALEANGLNFSGLSPDAVTLAERLSAAGYETVGVHAANYNFSNALGFDRGFDRYHEYPGKTPMGGRRGVEIAQRWLAERQQHDDAAPFFMMFHVIDPHLPYRLRREHFTQFGAPPIDVPEEALGVEIWDAGRMRGGELRDRIPLALRIYDSEVYSADAAVGAIVDMLPDDTIIVFLSDHGEEFDDHGGFEHGHTLYDELIRVPLFLRLPDGSHAGTTIDSAVSLVDVAATILHLAGIPVDDDMKGIPLPPVNDGAARPRDYLVSEAMIRGAQKTAIITDEYKYIYTHPRGYLGRTPGKVDDPRLAVEELYARSDTYERENLMELDSPPEIAATLRGYLFEYLEQSLHGIHVRCGSPGHTRGVQLRIDSTETIGKIKPVSMEPSDELVVHASRKTAFTTLRGDQNWVVLRLLEPGATISVEAREHDGDRLVPLYVGRGTRPVDEQPIELVLDEVGAPTANPRALDVPMDACRVWIVGGGGRAGAAARATGDDIAQLEALGYL